MIDKVTNTYQYHVDEWRNRLIMIRKNNSMLLGDQWDEELANTLRSQNRPVLSLNIELPLVMQLLGTQRKNPRSWKVVPVDQMADEQVAEIITKLLFFIANDNDLDQVDEQVFTSGVVGSIGIWEVLTSYNDDPYGEIKIYAGDNTEILIDPDAKDIYQRDWKRVTKAGWMTWSQMHTYYPDAGLEKRDPDMQSLGEAWKTLVERLNPALRSFRQDEYVDKKNELYKVIELWERKQERVDTIYNPGTGQIIEIKPGKLHTELVNNRGWEKVRSGIRYYQQCTVVCPYIRKVLLEKEYPYYYYPFVGFFPLLLANLPLADCISYTENLHGVQEEKNRSRSIIQDILNKQSNGAMVLPYGEDDLAEDMQNRSAEPGAIFLRSTNNPQRIEHLNSQFPSGYKILEDANDRDAQVISFQPLAQRGESESSDESGALFNSKVQQGLTAMQPIFSAFSRSRRLLSKVLIERIQKDYDKERMFRITGEMPEKNGQQSETITINEQSPYDLIINDVTVGKYDVMTTDEPFSRTQSSQQLKDWGEIIKIMPEDLLRIFLPEIIESSEINGRKDIAEKMRQMNQMMFGQQQQQQQLEMQQQQQQTPPGISGLLQQ